MTTLHGTILGLQKERGAQTAYRLQREGEGYREVSAADYLDLTLRFSAYLQSRGVGAGDRILLLSENGPEWTMAALAAMNLGAVVVPVAAISSPLEVQNTLKDARPKLSIVSRRLPSVRQIEEFLRAENLEYLGWDQQSEAPLAEWVKGRLPLPIREGSGSEQIFLIYTSGTTGSPKAVPISHENILSNARAVLQVIPATPSDRLVSVLPLSHMFEFTGGFVTPALLGCVVTYVKSLKPEDLLRALKESRATILIGVPLLFEVIARNLKGKMEELPAPLRKLLSLFSGLVEQFPGLGPWLFYPVHRGLGGHIRYFMAGGSRLQPKVFEFFRSIGLTILQGYGLTETSPVLTVTTMENAAPDHVGLAVPGTEVGVFNDLGESLPAGQEGEIWAKGPNVFKGYLNPEHSKGVFHGDWFRTGDLGVMDSQGLLRITGRKKDIIVTSGGKNVYPEEIEETVLAGGWFTEACALGLKDSSGHEKVALVVVPERGKFPGKNPEEIRKEGVQEALRLSRSLAEYKWPQRVELFFEELPKTSTRKVKKHEVRKLLEQEVKEKAQGASLDLSRDLESAIARGIQTITGISPAAIQLSDSLTTDIGLDSLTFVELICHVEKEFSTQIEGVDFASLQTVKDLIAVLELAGARGKRKKKVFFTEFSPWENGRVAWRLSRRLVNVILRSYLKIRHGLKVEGIENLRGGGPFIFTPNHTSHFDLLSIAASVPGNQLHSTFAVAAKDYFFNRSWKALGARIFVNAIPFDRKGRVDQSMALCREALAMGGSLVIFPEGTRSPDGSLQDFKTGVAHLLAGQPEVRAVPVFIDGAHLIMPKGHKFPGPGRLRIRYGKPISFGKAGSDQDSYREIARKLREEVKALSSL